MRSERSEIAAKHYRATTPEILLQAELAEIALAESLKGRSTPKFCPVDVIVDDVQAGVEVKTIQVSDNRLDGAQVHMNKRAKERKLQYAVDRSLRLFTVAIDLRRPEHPTYYVREGVGSFRLSSMHRVSTPVAVRRHLLKVCRDQAGLLDS